MNGLICNISVWPLHSPAGIVIVFELKNDKNPFGSSRSRCYPSFVRSGWHFHKKNDVAARCKCKLGDIDTFLGIVKVRTFSFCCLYACVIKYLILVVFNSLCIFYFSKSEINLTLITWKSEIIIHQEI